MVIWSKKNFLSKLFRKSLIFPLNAWFKANSLLKICVKYTRLELKFLVSNLSRCALISKLNGLKYILPEYLNLLFPIKEFVEEKFNTSFWILYIIINFDRFKLICNFFSLVEIFVFKVFSILSLILSNLKLVTISLEL